MSGGPEGPICPEAAVPSEITGPGLGAHILSLTSSDLRSAKWALGNS